MRDRTSPRASIAVLLLLTLIGSAMAFLPIPLFVQSVQASQNPVVPPGLVAYVPITITNGQSSPTPAPFQQMVQVDSATYSAYEAANLQNVEFFYSNGTLIPSWLESGASSSSANTFYWLRIAGGIRAGSSVTVYMGFASPTTNLFNAQTTGEAPDLSPSYGEYDDAGSVFAYEWNFAGTSLPSGWYFQQAAPSIAPDFGGYGVSNGAYFDTGKCGLKWPICANTVYGYFGTALNSSSYVITAKMQSYSGDGNNGEGVWFGWWSAPQSPKATTDYGVTDIPPYNGNYTSDLIRCPNWDCVQPFEVVSNGGSSQTVSSYDASQFAIYSMSWQGDSQVGTLIPPGGAPVSVSQTSSSPRGGSYYLGFWDYTRGVGDNGETVQWVTVSAMPPNGVMPSATVGSTVPTFITLSPPFGPVGASVTMTGAGLVASHAINATFQSWVRCPRGSGASCDIVYSTSVPLVLSGSCTTSSTGMLGGCTFVVPFVNGSLPQHTVFVSDGMNNPNATFTELTPAVSLQPSFGAVGTSVAIDGSGLIASQGLTVTYGGSAAGMPGTCTTDALGNISAGCTFIVPSSSALGTHTVAVSDGTNSPTATFTVTLLGLTCSKSPVVVGSATICKAAVHESGKKAPTGTVAWSSSGSGTFSKTSCTPSKRSTYSTCSVKYTPTSAGSALLTANYLGDSKNSASNGTYYLTATMKATKTLVSCSPSSVVAGLLRVVTCKAKVTGYLPTGTVSWSQRGTGLVFIDPTTCTLASLKNHNQATCSVGMVGTVAGRVTMQATYGGDPNNVGSSGTATLTIKAAT